MDFNVEERRTQLKSLHDFITSIQSQTSFIGQELGWSTECANENGVELVVCPENGEHRVPRGTLEMHVEKCRWRQDGYLDDDVPLPACPPGEQTHGKCVQIGKEEQMAVFREALLRNPSLNINCAGQRDDRPAPRTWWRWVADFTADERRVLYDYAVSRTAQQAPVKLEDLAVSYQKDKKQMPKSELEQLAEERDAKRRRISQRSKKVHTNRKSQTEILREVILNQMEVLEELQKQVSDVKAEENGDGHEAVPHDSGALKLSAGEDQSADGSGRSEDTAANVPSSLRQSMIGDYREDSPWRMLEREGRNPYVKENWERVYEKYNRRNRSYDSSPSSSDRREVWKNEGGRYGHKYVVSSVQNHQNRDRTERHGRRHGEEFRVEGRDREHWKLSRDSRGRSPPEGGRHRRYYGSEGYDGSGRSLVRAPRDQSPQRQKPPGKSKPASRAYADEARAHYNDETSTEHGQLSEGQSYPHYWGGGDSSLRRTYDRRSEHTRRSSGSEDRDGSSERSRRDKRSRSRARHHKKKKKKRKRRSSSSSDSSKTAYLC